MLKSNELTLGKLKELHGDTIGKKQWEADNGFKITTILKVTIRNGIINTKYLHIYVIHKNGRIDHWREQKNGSFKTV
jgi:hypothetical protein